ncbi:MAG: co-chaperone GroES [Candidatus Pacearchaeota archaeon]
MRVIPLGERVLLKMEKAKEEITKGGIYLPKSDDEKKQGVVVAVGKDKDGKDLPLNVGEKVLYSGYSNEEIEIDNEKHVIVEFKDIIAKLEA